MAKYIHRQIITTRWRGPTNTQPARVTARCHAGRITISVHDTSWEQHHRACQALVNKLGWTEEYYGEWYGGPTTQAGDVCVWLPIRKQDLIN